MINKYTIQKAYSEDSKGRERVIWRIVAVSTDSVIDAFDLRRDAKYYCDMWNSDNS